MRLRKLRETQEGFLRYLDKNRDLLIKEAEIEEREGRMRERLENGEWIDEEGDEEEEEEEEDEEVVDETEVSKLVGMVKSKMQKAKKRAGTKLEGRFFPNA